MWTDPATHECGPVCMVTRPRGDVFCTALGQARARCVRTRVCADEEPRARMLTCSIVPHYRGGGAGAQVVFEAPAERAPAASRTRSARDMHCKGVTFGNTVRSVLARLLSSTSRVTVETARAHKARAGALRLLRSRLAEARTKKQRLVLPHLLHAAWEHMERAGGDAPVAVHMGEAAQAEIASACADYFAAYVARGPVAGKHGARPSADYIALALLYKMPGVPSQRQASLRAFLPDLRTLKNYGFDVHKYTNAQRYVSHAAVDAMCGPKRAAPPATGGGGGAKASAA